MHTGVINLFMLVFLALPCEADDWIFPVQNSLPTVPTKPQLLLFQSADIAIWEHASREFVMRFIIPGIVFPGTEKIEVCTIVPNKGTQTYSREIVILTLDDKHAWRMNKKEVQTVDTLQVKKCHASFKKILLSIRYIDKIMGPAPDGIIVNWECSRELDGLGFRMQATQFDMPKTEDAMKVINSISDLMRGMN